MADAAQAPTQPSTQAMARQKLRTSAIAAREALSADVHAALSTQIAAQLGALLASQPPGVVGFCWPYRAEFDARSVVTDLLGKGWRAALPIVQPEIKRMTFRAWRPESPMAADVYGIHYPAQGQAETPTVLLLPFNVLDAQGFRLGYGAGYFDRTLASMDPRPWVIGVGFSLGLTSSVEPQAHDIPVDCAVTELSLQDFSGRRP